jgi:hypothetical protein
MIGTTVVILSGHDGSLGTASPETCAIGAMGNVAFT